MAALILPVSRLREVVAYDPETGVFIKKVRGKYRAIGDVATYQTAYGYDGIKIDGQMYLAHRLAWLYVHGDMPDGQIDHINGIKTDNRIANLRVVTLAVNVQNKRTAQKNNQSGLLGVSVRKSGFQAKIKINRKTIYLGHFKTAELAHEAYLEAKRKVHSEGCTL